MSTTETASTPPVSSATAAAATTTTPPPQTQTATSNPNTVSNDATKATEELKGADLHWNSYKHSVVDSLRETRDAVLNNPSIPDEFKKKFKDMLASTLSQRDSTIKELREKLKAEGETLRTGHERDKKIAEDTIAELRKQITAEKESTVKSVRDDLEDLRKQLKAAGLGDRIGVLDESILNDPKMRRVVENFSKTLRSTLDTHRGSMHNSRSVDQVANDAFEMASQNMFSGNSNASSSNYVSKKRINRPNELHNNRGTKKQSTTRQPVSFTGFGNMHF